VERVFAALIMRFIWASVLVSDEPFYVQTLARFMGRSLEPEQGQQTQSGPNA